MINYRSTGAAKPAIKNSKISRHLPDPRKTSRDLVAYAAALEVLG